jgi:hypothetical protein
MLMKSSSADQTSEGRPLQAEPEEGGGDQNAAKKSKNNSGRRTEVAALDQKSRRSSQVRQSGAF